MNRDRIQAQYARHPQSSLDILAKRLAKKKWGMRDIIREDESHSDEFDSTGEDKEYLDRYIIARIAEQYDRKAKCKQAVLRALWEKEHNGESFDSALPNRMARFRQYEDSPFGNYQNPIEQKKWEEWNMKSDDDIGNAWKRYVKTAEFSKEAVPRAKILASHVVRRPEHISNRTVNRIIRDILIPQYWGSKAGRGVSHLNDVMSSARQLAGRKLTPIEKLTIAIHDIGVGRPGFERTQHQVGSIDAVMKDRALRRVKRSMTPEIREAVLNHMKDQYKETGILSRLHQLLVEADEGRPVFGTKRIEKPVKYWLDGRNKSMPPDTPLSEVLPHIRKVLKGKVKDFSSGKPPFTDRYARVFAPDIARASEWANNVSDNDILEVIARMRSSGKKM